MPQPADNGLTYTFKIREGVRFHDGTPLTAHDVATSWRRIVFPPTGIASPRRTNFLMVDRIEDPDATTVIFRLKFPTLTFIPALATPWSYLFAGVAREGSTLLRAQRHWIRPVQVRAV